jgi:putative membrane protein
MKNQKYHILLLLLFTAIFVWSMINPHDRFTWFLEVLPAVIGLVVLVIIYPKFKFTNLVYSLILVHATILLVGGHYTYAEVPMFNWLRDAFDLNRNYYDRLGHFAQGFIPAIIAREILIRKFILRNEKKWLFFIVVSICLAISASYELMEFAVALLTGESAEAFLGTQGDVWDTQWDMSLALIGAISALITLKNVHDRALANQ